MHPAMSLSSELADLYETIIIHAIYSKGALARLYALKPLFALRWAAIVLGDFLPEQWAHRVKNGANPEKWAEIKNDRLLKAMKYVETANNLINYPHPLSG